MTDIPAVEVQSTVADEYPIEIAKQHRLDSLLLGIGKTLVERRRHLGISAKDLAQVSGVSASHISMVERAERVPSMETLFLLCEALETSVPALLLQTLEEQEQIDLMAPIIAPKLANLIESLLTTRMG